MSSMCGRFGAPSRAAYTCTKWAVEGLSECLRAEMKRWNVHVVVVEPGNFVAGKISSILHCISKQKLTKSQF